MEANNYFCPTYKETNYMAHDTHHDTHHHAPVETRPTTSFKASFWFVLILAGLFIAAVNFVGVMSHDGGEEGHGGGTHNTEAAHEAGHEGTREATATQTLEGETGVGKDAGSSNQHHGAGAAADSTTVEGH
jgi:hypothetical protein